MVADTYTNADLGCRCLTADCKLTVMHIAMIVAMLTCEWALARIWVSMPACLAMHLQWFSWIIVQ